MPRTTKVFISVSINSKHESAQTKIEWANGFRREICRIGNYDSEEVYIYTDFNVAPLNAEITPEILEKLKQANYLFCLLSEEYLSSVWCAYEHHQFGLLEKSIRPHYIGVVTPFINYEVYADKARFAKRIQTGIGRMTRCKNQKKNDALMQYVSGTWRSWLLDNRHIDLHLQVTPPAPDQSTGKLLEVALAKQKSEAIVGHAALAAYCLGADRYREGGWGFSLGNEFDVDEQDGDELPRGRYDMNVLSMRALGHFLKEDTFITEWGAVFEKAGIERNPRKRVKDRLPEVASLLVCLENSKPMVAELKTRATQVSLELSPEQSSSRWTLESGTSETSPIEYHPLLLACVSKLVSVAGDSENNTIRAALSKLRLTERHLEVIQSVDVATRKWIAENDIVALILQRSKRFHQGWNSAQSMKAAIVWLVLADSIDGCKALRTHLAEKWGTLDNEKLINVVDQALGTDDPEMLTLAFVAAVALPSADARWDGFVSYIFGRVFRKNETYRLVPSLNAVAWVAIILIAFKQAEVEMDKELLRSSWQFGRDLRERRLEAVTKLAEQGELNSEALQGLVDEFPVSMARWLLEKTPRGGGAGAAPTQERERNLVESLTRASFWSRLPNTNGDEGASAFSALSGLLRVRLDNRVDLDSPGYNRMFLHPFSEITGMKVLDLKGIRREFGESDVELVRIMGKTTVLEIFERGDNSYSRTGRTFEERTEAIVNAIKDELWPRERGFDDLLLVRRGTEGTRWIHRSALVQRYHTGERIISWRFVEMPPSVANLTSSAT